MKPENKIDSQVFLNKLIQLDELLNMAREELTKESGSITWLFKPFIKAFTSTPFAIGSSAAWYDKMLALFVNPAAILIPSLAGAIAFLPVELTYEPPKWLLIIGIIVFLVSTLKNHFKQLDIFDENFDINAFRVVYPRLYKQIRVMKNTEPFSFTLLNEQLTSASHHQTQELLDLYRQLEDVNQDMSGLSSELSEVEELLDKSKQELQLSMRLFEKAINAIKAQCADMIEKDILHVFTDFSLFWLDKEQDKLICIAKHNAYTTPSEILLSDEQRKDWSVVRAAQALSPSDSIQSDQSHDRVVISNKFNVLGDTYVYSFHFQSREFDKYSTYITDVATQTLLYNLILLYNKEKGGRDNG